MEEFRKIELNQSYSVSNLGNVRNDKTGKILKPQSNGQGYLKVRLYNGSGDDYIIKPVHRLVAYAFQEICGEYSEGLQVDHINTVRNDNRAVNLRWVTPTENRLNPITNDKFKESVSGEKHWMYGKHHTDETKMKMSENHKGIPGFWTGKHLTEECKRKKSLSMTGKHWKLVDGVRVWY